MGELATIIMSLVGGLSTYNPLAGFNSTPLASDVCCHATAHDRTSLLVSNAFGDPGSVSAIAKSILLESSCCRETRVLLVWAVKLVAAVCAKLALPADSPDPFDASTVPNFPFVMHVVTYSNDDTSTLVTGNPLGGGLHGHTERCPFIMNQGFI